MEPHPQATLQSHRTTCPAQPTCPSGNAQQHASLAATSTPRWCCSSCPHTPQPTMLHLFISHTHAARYLRSIPRVQLSSCLVWAHARPSCRAAAPSNRRSGCSGQHGSALHTQAEHCSRRSAAAARATASAPHLPAQCCAATTSALRLSPPHSAQRCSSRLRPALSAASPRGSPG